MQLQASRPARSTAARAGPRPRAAPGSTSSQRTQAAGAPAAGRASAPIGARAAAAGSGAPPRLLPRAPAGEALPPALQHEMGRRFGADFGGVRVHSDGAAAAAAAGLGARAYTHGRDIVFGRGQYAPGSGEGRGLLAHELTHVAQQQRAGAAVQRSVADGGARKVSAGGDAAEAEARANAAKVQLPHAPLSATALPQQPVQADLLDGVADVASAVGGAISDAGSAVAGVAGDAAEAVAGAVGDVAMALVREVAPQLEPIIRQGPFEWLKERVSEAFAGIAGALNSLDPSGTLTLLLELFTGLVSRAAGIVAALASGDCQPLLDAIGQLKDFVTEVAGAAWDKLTEFLAPIGQFFSALWAGYGAPAVEWLQQFAGGVWDRVQQFGTDLWNWTQPIRDAVGDAWGWVKEQLFGPDDAASGDRSGGIVGWVTTKVSEAWDWVKEQTRPVWQPISDAAERIAELLPLPFLRDLGTQAGALSAQLESSATAMAGGEAVAENRDTLAAVLPGVQRIVGSVRGVIVRAGAWLGDKVGAVGATVNGLMSQLRSVALLSALASALGWLEGAANRLVGWVQGGVGALFERVLGAFDALSPFIEAAAGVVRRLIGVVGNLLRLPQLVLSTVWEAIPCCIREPIKNFVIQQILGRIPVFGQFFTDPSLWPRVQATALRILRQVFVDGDIPGAAWTFFRSILAVLGLPPQLVVQVLAKAAAAFGDILGNPVGFLLNLLGAVRAGFGRFFDNILTHLLNGVTGWLMGHVRDAGITPPRDFSLRSILGFVLDVLGVTAERIWAKLERRLDPAVVRRLRQMLAVATGVWRFVTILVEQGPAGLWEELQGQLGNLWDTLLNGVIGWITERVINRAVRWLMGLLDVSGVMPVINALIAVYNAIESFVQYLRQMLEIVSRVLDGILGIARGAIDAAAGFLEGALANSLPVAIGFLANQFGLGRMGERIRELVETVQGVVDRALDWLIDRAIRLGQALIDLARRGAAAVGSAVRSALSWLGLRVGFTAANGQGHALYFRGEGAAAVLTVESEPQPFRAWLDSLPSTASAADRAEARRLFEEIQRLQRVSPPAPSPAGAAAAPSPDDPNVRIPALMNELSVVAARLMPADGIAPSSPPVYGSLRHGFGTTASVATLTRRFTPGSEPGGSAEGGLWEDLRMRLGRAGGSSYYVRGHLINHHLGGSGETWANLTPLTQAANNRGIASMYRSFERPVKQAVLDDHRTVRDFQVHAVEGQPARGGDLSAIDRELDAAQAGRPRQTNRTPATLRTIRRVVEAEQYIPASLSLRAQVLAADGSANPVAAPVPNTIDTDWKRYEVRAA